MVVGVVVVVEAVVVAVAVAASVTVVVAVVVVVVVAVVVAVVVEVAVWVVPALKLASTTGFWGQRRGDAAWVATILTMVMTTARVATATSTTMPKTMTTTTTTTTTMMTTVGGLAALREARLGGWGGAPPGALGAPGARLSDEEAGVDNQVEVEVHVEVQVVHNNNRVPSQHGCRRIGGYFWAYRRRFFMPLARASRAPAYASHAQRQGKRRLLGEAVSLLLRRRRCGQQRYHRLVVLL